MQYLPNTPFSASAFGCGGGKHGFLFSLSVKLHLETGSQFGAIPLLYATRLPECKS